MLVNDVFIGTDLYLINIKRDAEKAGLKTPMLDRVVNNVSFGEEEEENVTVDHVKLVAELKAAQAAGAGVITALYALTGKAGD